MASGIALGSALSGQNRKYSPKIMVSGPCLHTESMVPLLSQANLKAILPSPWNIMEFTKEDSFSILFLNYLLDLLIIIK